MDRDLEWLLDSGEPWTRYRTLTDLMFRPETDPQVQDARAAMIEHPQVRTLITKAAGWPGYALTRHNDAGHAIYAMSTLADFGLRHDDPGMAEAVHAILSHRSQDGALQTQLRLYKRFGGLEGEYWTWLACDAPTLVYSLLALGMGKDDRVKEAVDHLLTLVAEEGWCCEGALELGGFKGPGSRDDPCPIANVYALKALSLLPELEDSAIARLGIDMLLGHWQDRQGRRIRMFGIGSEFRKLKYPYIWYDILHVCEVLSRFPQASRDPRFGEMFAEITKQQDAQGRYQAGSMYMAWKGWSFADKKRPSPWITFLVRRMSARRRASTLVSPPAMPRS